MLFRAFLTALGFEFVEWRAYDDALRRAVTLLRELKILLAFSTPGFKFVDVAGGPPRAQARGGFAPSS